MKREELLSIIQKAAKRGEWRAAAWLLERELVEDVPTSKKKDEPPSPPVPFRPTCSYDDIIHLVAGYYGVSHLDLLAPADTPMAKSQRSALARGVAMYLMRSVCRASYPEIGRFFGRDHTTVMHAIKKIDADKDADTMLNLDYLRKRLTQGAPTIEPINEG